MKKIILSTASLMLLLACNTNESNTVENLQDSTIVDTPLQEEAQIINANKSLSAFINSIDLNASADTFYFEEQFEQPVEGQAIDASNIFSNKYKIEFSYETSLVVNDVEDKSCVLYNGKHSYYPWQSLIIYENNSFLVPIIEQNIIPINDYYFHNIINDLKNNCNETSFLDAVKDSTKINEISKTIISTYYLKFTNEITTKILVIKAQYGC
ncbi:MAG: hypothetical protein ACEQSR_06125 [Candidatus Methylacidiphilales bacterium]